MAKKKTYSWVYAPDRRTKPKVPDDLKREVQAKADDLVKKVLEPKYLKPPPKKPQWNYPIELWTKWHSSFFYFGSTWASPGPNRIAPTFEVRFARLEYVGEQKFNLAYMRHNEQWWTIHHGLTLAQCMKLIGEDGPFTLV